MEENKTPKTDIKKNKEENGFFGRLSDWFNGIVGEFKRITWPGRVDLVKMVVIVIVTSGVFGGIIVLYDFLLAAGYDGLVGLFG